MNPPLSVATTCRAFLDQIGEQWCIKDTHKKNVDNVYYTPLGGKGSQTEFSKANPWEVISKSSKRETMRVHNNLYIQSLKT